MSVSDPPRIAPPRPARGASRRRVTGRRYMLRRAVALLVVAALVAGGVRAMSAILGDDNIVATDPEADTADTTVPQALGSLPDTTEPADGAGAVLADTVAGASNPEVDTVAPVESDPAVDDGPPSPENPAAVYIVGDSDAGTFGPYLQRLLDGTLITETELNYKVSSGLARPDFFNWPSELAAKLPDVDPDIVVVTFGGNDSQGLAVESGEFVIGDPVQNATEWSEEYERRAGEVMDLLLEDGRTVIWVGIPNDDNADVTARLAIQDQAVKAAAAARPGILFVDTWTRFSGRDGGWAEFVIDPRDGQGKDVRASDGFHLNEIGAEILALDIAQAIRDDLRARGAAI